MKDGGPSKCKQVDSPSSLNCCFLGTLFQENLFLRRSYWIQCRDQQTKRTPAIMDVATSYLLYLRLREHEEGGAEGVKEPGHLGLQTKVFS
ncbi:rCG49789 [Rattus norvegicus]|uniref:RCG49789 n=1 Tax=Rattus norvegicus TaxID=10116 RepID=A6K4G4_RAT|nr:rCG49789 [Rattus norvegicus]